MISVIIPCYNAERWIGEALTSVLSQADVPLEVIVVDDGSTDGSAELVARQFSDVRLVRTPNGGPSRARNLGTKLAQGAFLQYLDADDWLAPRKLAAQLAALQTTGADIAYGVWQHVYEAADSTRSVGPLVDHVLPAEAELALFTGDFWCPIHAYLYRRSIVERTAGFLEQLPVIQDVRFTLDCARSGARFVRVDGHITQYRIHSISQNSRRSQVRFARDVLQNVSDIEAIWRTTGPLNERQREALIRGYGFVARSTFVDDKVLFAAAYSCLESLSPRYVPSAPRGLALLSRLIGYPRAEAVALRYRQSKGLLKGLARRLRRPGALPTTHSPTT